MPLEPRDVRDAKPMPVGHASTSSSGAEFRTLREGLGLTLEVAAELLDAKTRTVSMWERTGPPSGPAMHLRRLHDEVEHRVAEALDNYAIRRLAAGAPVKTRLVRYSTVQRYGSSDAATTGVPYVLPLAGLTRLHAALLRLGAQVEVVWDTEVAR